MIWAFIAKHWKLFAFGAAVLAALAYGEVHGFGRGKASGERAVRATEVAAANQRADAAEKLQQAVQAQAARYKTQAESQAAIATQYQEALNDANRKHDRTVADLRSGNLSLQRRWQGCAAQVPTAGRVAPGGLGPDGQADDRAASAARIVRAAAACDSQVIGLQAILNKERE